MIKNKQPGVMTRYNSFQVPWIVATLSYQALEMTMMQNLYEHITGKVILMHEHLMTVLAIKVSHITHQNVPNLMFMKTTLEVIMEKVRNPNKTCLNVND